MLGAGQEEKEARTAFLVYYFEKGSSTPPTFSWLIKLETPRGGKEFLEMGLQLMFFLSVSCFV